VDELTVKDARLVSSRLNSSREAPPLKIRNHKPTLTRVTI